jgi:hypothetical protein
MNPDAQSGPLQMQTSWYAVFAESVRLALAPLILLVAGFFTANFVVSGQYSWPLTSRALVLTLTVLIFCYEFVYKEQLSRNVSSDRAKAALLYCCIIPYVIGWAIMLVLWKL